MKNAVKIGAVLMLSGSTLDMSNVQSVTPVQHRKATPDVVANYIQDNRLNWNYSDQRKKEILANIAGIRTQIRKMAATKMIETIASTMENRARNRDSQLRHERAQEIHIPARLISADTLRKRKGMPVIDIEELAIAAEQEIA
jgi:hypothetical protein